MPKQFSIDDRVAFKTKKSFGKRGIIKAIVGVGKNQKFTVKCDDGSENIVIKRVLCFEPDFSPSLLQIKAKKTENKASIAAAALEDEASVSSSGSSASSESATDEIR